MIGDYGLDRDCSGRLVTNLENEKAPITYLV